MWRRIEHKISKCLRKHPSQCPWRCHACQTDLRHKSVLPPTAALYHRWESHVRMVLTSLSARLPHSGNHREVTYNAWRARVKRARGRPPQPALTFWHAAILAETHVKAHAGDCTQDDLLTRLKLYQCAIEATECRRHLALIHNFYTSWRTHSRAAWATRRSEAQVIAYAHVCSMAVVFFTWHN